MPMSTPKVSVITALHNKGPYVAETIQSVLAQTMPEWEMVIVENGSTDNGLEIVRKFKDDRIRLIISPKHGPGAARNFGLARASGEWILFLDADDLIKPKYLEDRLSVLRSIPVAKVIVGPWKEFDDQNPENESARYPAGWEREPVDLDSAAFAYAPWIVHAALVRRDHLMPNRLWNENLDALPSEDCAFWFPVIHGTPVAWSHHDGALYRRNISSSRDDTIKSISKRFNAYTGTIQSNLNFLLQRGEHPTPAQSATVVRVLRSILSATENAGAGECSRIRGELSRWLRATSYLDLRMLYWRIKFGVLGHAVL
jgi:glycosyltransferase involved in cell wall biosynthesis